MSRSETSFGAVYSAVGQISSKDGRPVVVTQPGVKGVASYGPYIPLPSGSYVANFPIETNAVEQVESAFAVAQIYLPTRDLVLASADITSGIAKSHESILMLPFRLEKEEVCEFRILTEGGAGLHISQDISLRSNQSQLTCGEGQRTDVPDELHYLYSGLLIKNWEHFRKLKALGVEVRSANGIVNAKWGDVTVNIVNMEDYQVFYEIYLQNDYCAREIDPLCVIDIGMNSGYASLYFSSWPNVTTVNSYEPFAVPFERAWNNFALNSSLSKKIFPHNVGIGSADEILKLMYDSDYTISGSVRGYQAGNEVSVTIRDAGILSGVIRTARANGEKVLLKMDCEGSEFAIIDRLFELGLLRQIDILVAEWHKWWSKEKTQADIIEKLLASGHTVFDRTRIDNDATGMIFSVRVR